jgi:ATP-dependent 26S proteasome regulatory subunit
MTTNGAELLEPALAERPGRVDQAVEFPLPDEDARAQLIALFSRGLDLALDDAGAVVAATEGVSPAFLRELVRKAALQAAIAGSDKIDDGHFRAALAILESGGSVTRAMLGADGGAAAQRLGPSGWEGGGGGAPVDIVEFDDLE